MSKPKSNQREEIRFAIQNGKAQIDGNSGVFAFLKGAPAALPIINLSTTGLRLLSKNKLNVNDKVSLTILIPLLGAKPLKLSGQVAWLKTFAIFEEYLVGIKFDGLKGDVKKRLKHLTDFLGTRIQPNRKIAFKKIRKKSTTCIVCQFADKHAAGASNIMKFRNF